MGEDGLFVHHFCRVEIFSGNVKNITCKPGVHSIGGEHR